MRTRLPCTLFVVLAAAAGCGTSSDEGTTLGAAGPDAAYCPVAKPEQDASCGAAPAGAECTFLIEACACGPSDIEWSCTCRDGSWDCSRGYDCYPCPDAGS